MFDPNRICLGCMEELENGAVVCPKCGWNNAANNNVSHQLLAGSVLLGKYLVGRVLGEGGFGITYIGWDLILERKVAIKEFYPQGIVNRELTHRSTVVSCVGKEEFIEKEKEGFIKEAKTMAKLGNIPGIVTMHDVFAQNGTVYIVMDYVKGKTLKAYVKENGNRLPVQQVISFLEPIFKALQNVHEKGLIHRDISPDNIMLRPDGTAVLLDFGAARQMSVAGERSLTVNLKHGYAPMEQYQTRGVQGPWTDVYALSATIYRLITGKVPPSAADRIIEDDLPLPSTLGADILSWQEKALMHGLAVRTADRILNVSELWEGLTTDPAAEPAQVQSPENPVEENESVESEHISAVQGDEKNAQAEPSKEIKKQAKEDSVNQAEECEKPSDAVNEEKKGKEEAKQPEKKRKGENTKLLVILSAILTVLLLMLIFEPSIAAFSNTQKEIAYKKGVNLFENREYSEAYKYFTKAGKYKDADDYCHKSLGYNYCKEMELDKAIEEFRRLKYFGSVVAFLTEYNEIGRCPYFNYSFLDVWDTYEDAIDLVLGDHGYYYSRDSTDNIKEAVYCIAMESMEQEEYFRARDLFEIIRDYSNSAYMIKNINDTMTEYIKGHQSEDDYRTCRYLDMLEYDHEWARENWNSLYHECISVGTFWDSMWTLDRDGTLTISGECSYADAHLTLEQKDMVRRLVINEGIKAIDNDFAGFDLESVEIPSTVEYISSDAFDESVIPKIKISKDNKYYTVVNGKLVKIGD